MTFLQACREGELVAAQNCTHRVGERNKAFRSACKNGHLEVAQWVYSLGGVDHHARNEWAFRKACAYCNLEIIQYLLSLTVSEDVIVECLKYKSCQNILQQHIRCKKIKSARSVNL